MNTGSKITLIDSNYLLIHYNVREITAYYIYANYKMHMTIGYLKFYACKKSGLDALNINTIVVIIK